MQLDFESLPLTSDQAVIGRSAVRQIHGNTAVAAQTKPFPSPDKIHSLGTGGTGGAGRQKVQCRVRRAVRSNRPRAHHIAVGMPTTCDEHLLSIENEAVLCFLGSGIAGVKISTGAALAASDSALTTE